MPRVHKLKTPERCEGIRWSEVPLKALYPWGRGRKNPPTGTKAYRCRNNGWWKFTALAPRRDPLGEFDFQAQSGTYCWVHLWKQIHDHTREYEHFLRWFKRQPEYKEWYGSE